jgi:release factor glutamine methyltransferase
MLDGENVYTLLKSATKFLKSRGLLEPKSDVEVLLSFVLQTKRSKLSLLRSQKPTDRQILQYENYVLKRSIREPVAYIIGLADFMGFEFKVNKNVFIPRPETEILVEITLKIAKEKNKKSILDLCTGSGCIAISLAKLGIFEDISASDVSVNALAVAKENALINNALNVKFIESNIFEKILDCKFDMIVSNPPYITEYEYADLEAELKFEPKNALTASDDGLFFYKEIVANTAKYLNDGGYIILELNSNKAENIRQIFLDNKYADADIETINDYSGLPRILKVLKF